MHRTKIVALIRSAIENTSEQTEAAYLKTIAVVLGTIRYTLQPTIRRTTQPHIDTEVIADMLVRNDIIISFVRNDDPLDQILKTAHCLNSLFNTHIALLIKQTGNKPVIAEVRR